MDRIKYGSGLMLFLRTASVPVHNETVKPLEGGDKTLDFEESRSSSTCEGTRNAQGAREASMVNGIHQECTEQTQHAAGQEAAAAATAADCTLRIIGSAVATVTTADCTLSSLQ